MSKKQKKQGLRILITAMLFTVAIFLPLNGVARAIVFLAIYAWIGWDILWSAIRNIARGQVFDENFLMAVATVGAIVLGEYSEGVAVMLFYQIGDWFEHYALGNSRRSIARLMDIRPDFANLRLADGSSKVVDPEEVEIGQCIVVKPGERIPLDGLVTEGSSLADTSALTGEAMPRDIYPGLQVISGCINLTGTLYVQVEKRFGESTVAKILDLVENASSKKSMAENFITRFARYYTPAVCIAALGIGLLVPLATGQPFDVWVYRALTFLVISCPCALVISVPLSFFGGIGGASKSGVLVKGGNYLETLSKVDTVVFDKTGTLTTGRFAVTEVYSSHASKESLLEMAAYGEHFSNHPIALSVKSAYKKDIEAGRVSKAVEVAGQGTKVFWDGGELLVGNARMMEQGGIAVAYQPEGGTAIHVAYRGEYQGYLLVEDVVKPDAKEAIEDLKKIGVYKTVLLTGDLEDVGKKVAASLGIDQVFTQLLPDGKVEKVEQLLKRQRPKSKLAFVGDGINDAPVLARADVGIAMGGLGSDAAIEAADVVIMTDEPSKIATVIKIGRKTMRIVKQNIVFALGIKSVVLLLGAMGQASMWAAVFADVGVSVLAILNAMRALKPPVTGK